MRYNVDADCLILGELEAGRTQRNMITLPGTALANDDPLASCLTENIKLRFATIETRSRPHSLAARPRGFAFYVARPGRSIRG